ncbi:MAG: hypothetical protein ABIR47_09195 [Candidatus Kapaibacterium sp.]
MNGIETVRRYFDLAENFSSDANEFVFSSSFRMAGLSATEITTAMRRFDTAFFTCLPSASLL